MIFVSSKKFFDSTSRREGSSRSHPRKDPRGPQQSKGARPAGGYGHQFEHGSISHDRSANTDSFGDRKRSRHDVFTNLPFGNDGPEAKKFRHSRRSSHGHPRDECCHGNHHRTSSYPLHDEHLKDDRYHGDYHKTSTYPSHKRDYCSSRHVSDLSRSRKPGDHEQSSRYLPRELPRLKSGHKRPHLHESPLPVGGATSSSSTLSCEVVPYTSSEASCSSDRSGNVGSQKVAVSVVVMSIQDCNLVPSLPEKYYRCDGDGVSADV